MSASATPGGHNKHSS